jgi:transposase-like protein
MIWLYLRFTLSFRDVEHLLAERGIMVSYETVRRWVNHFGPKIAAETGSPAGELRRAGDFRAISPTITSA